MEFKTRLGLALIFGLGTMVHAFLTVRRTREWESFISSFFIGVVTTALMTGKGDDYDPYLPLLAGFVAFSLGVGILYASVVIPTLLYLS